MARKKSPHLTGAELRLMRLLWERRQATVAELGEDLRGELAYNTVLTMMGILEKKGYVGHEKQGRAFVYRPRIDQSQARRKALRYLLSQFFDNSPELLVLNILEHEKLEAKELARLKQWIEGSAS